MKKSIEVKDSFPATIKQNLDKNQVYARFLKFPVIPGKLGWITGNLPISGNSKNPGNIRSLVKNEEFSKIVIPKAKKFPRSK